MIPVFPERASTLLSQIELLSDASLDELQGLWNFVAAPIRTKQVNVIAGNDVVKDGQAVAPLCFEQPMAPSPPVSQEPQQELPLMTSVGDVPDLSRAEDTVCSRHFVKAPILGHKTPI
jgi:hypothetical protein